MYPHQTVCRHHNFDRMMIIRQVNFNFKAAKFNHDDNSRMSVLYTILNLNNCLMEVRSSTYGLS